MFNVNIYQYILLIVGVISILAYIYGTFRKGSSEASAQSNEILRNLLKDQGKEIELLKTTVAHQTDQIAVLEGQVRLSSELRTLVADSLKSYFLENPEKAQQLINKVKIT